MSVAIGYSIILFFSLAKSLTAKIYNCQYEVVEYGIEKTCDFIGISMTYWNIALIAFLLLLCFCCCGWNMLSGLKRTQKCQIAKPNCVSCAELGPFCERHSQAIAKT